MFFKGQMATVFTSEFQEKKTREKQLTHIRWISADIRWEKRKICNT